VADLPSDPSALVTQLLEVMHHNEPAEILEYFAPDGIWHNMPMEPAVGREAIGELLKTFIAQGVLVTKVDLVNQVAQGNVVMNERVDHVTMGATTMAVPVCGVFVIEGGRIKAWRDYFDAAPMAAAAGA
jgi:limonene-1,2-epoxide hydrolase